MDDIYQTVPLHPLPPKNYPGNLSLLWKVKNDLIGFWPESAYRDEYIYGKIINRSMYIANSPETVEHVFVTRHDIYERKSPFMRKALKPLLGDGLFVSDGKTWAERRKIEAPAFTPKYLKQFSSIMVECAIEWRDRWSIDYPDKSVPVLTEMAGLTAEILSRTMFGNDLGRENSGKIVEGFAKYQAKINQLDLSSFFGLPEWLPKLPQMRGTIKMAQQIHGIVDSLILEHLNNPVSQGTLLSMLLKGYDPENPDGMSLEQVRNEAVVILMAGHETTANTLAWAWYLLSVDPRVKEIFHKEIDSVIGKRLPCFDDVTDLVYTRAIIEETLRLYPPVPVLSREAMAADQIGDIKINEGAIMLVVPWLLHRHEKYWEKPNHFIPERFTREWPKRREKYAYVPFSTGPRTCLGMAFGLTESILVLATLSQLYELSLEPGYVPDYECRLTLRPKHNLPMRLNQRH